MIADHHRAAKNAAGLEPRVTLRRVGRSLGIPRQTNYEDAEQQRTHERESTREIESGVIAAGLIKNNSCKAMHSWTEKALI